MQLCSLRSGYCGSIEMRKPITGIVTMEAVQHLSIVTMEAIQHLRITLEDIKLATNNFSPDNLIAKGGFGNVYIGKLTAASGQQNTVAVKRWLDRTMGQGDREFLMEIQMLWCYRHRNVISLVGFCEESGEKILVYEHAQHGSLDRHLADDKLSWIQRLKISLGAARGFNYLHDEVGPQHRVLHRDIKSSNILLDENWEARISDFGLSKIGPSNVEFTFLVTNACGTYGYIDPEYRKTGVLTKESDVYSFGVVLFELLCGRPALVDGYQDERRFLDSFARQSYELGKLHEIILPCIKNDIKVESLNVFSMVAYQCLEEKRTKRPTMACIVEQLEKALELQDNNKTTRFIRVGVWGKESGDPHNKWSFELEQGHKLQKITIDHGDDVIYSLMFTTECKGVLHASNKVVGCCPGGQTISEVTFDVDEEIVHINGSNGTRDGYTVISSLSFETNKRRTHGPFGRTSNSVFSIPWENGSLVGFYGLAGCYIDSIGVYLKAHEEILRIGTWGKRIVSPQNDWSFDLQKNHRLKNITIDHGDLIYTLRFTTQYRGVTSDSGLVGGWGRVPMVDGDEVSKVMLDWNEEITGISGTVAKSRGSNSGYTIISSISFVTNKKTHGPFGTIRGSSFTVSWEDGTFAGFYGLCGGYLDSIGVYLKATKYDLKI